MDSSTKTQEPPRGDLPGHLIDSIDALSEFHLAHHRAASLTQRILDRLTALVGTPAALIAMVLGIALWTGLILAFNPSGGHLHAFSWLALAATCAALLVAVLILVTQRREDVLAERRSQLTLELAILADKKAAKIIALLEEMRRDTPHLSNRIDAESDEMATPTDVLEVVAAIDQRAGEV